MLSRFEAIVVRAGEKVFAVSKWVCYLNSVIAVVLLTYRYGFRLSEEEVEEKCDAYRPVCTAKGEKIAKKTPR